MPLTDTTVRNAKPRKKLVKLFDGGGLYLLIQPHGTKLWRMDYRIVGKQKTLAFGIYPTISLAEARHRRDVDERKYAQCCLASTWLRVGCDERARIPRDGSGKGHSVATWELIGVALSRRKQGFESPRERQ
ncbi:MAG TPA: Arm DNA-binding domain-containing protein [Pseudolabrys sp.]|nr:Arm DNA-binding domain-containing protein [Pseudolabrys sp.]